MGTHRLAHQYTIPAAVTRMMKMQLASRSLPTHFKRGGFLIHPSVPLVIIVTTQRRYAAQPVTLPYQNWLACTSDVHPNRRGAQCAANLRHSLCSTE